MAKIRNPKRGKKSFEPVDFEKEIGVGPINLILPPELPKKSFDEVMSSIKRELELVSVGLSKNCATAIQFVPEKNPFCRVLVQLKDPVTGQQVQELVRLAFQDFGNKFAEFVKEEFRNLF